MLSGGEEKRGGGDGKQGLMGGHDKLHVPTNAGCTKGEGGVNGENVLNSDRGTNTDGESVPTVSRPRDETKVRRGKL